MLRWLPLVAGALPLIAMFGAFAIGVSYGTLPDCNPIIDGCRSISATGRQPPGSFLFRATMMPQAIVLAFTWYLSWLWLRQLRPDIGRNYGVFMLIAGVVNPVALIIYVTFLGTSEPIYEFMRRIGIYFGFLGIAVAQLAITIALLRTELRSLARIMLGLIVVVFAIGILNLVLKATLADPDPAENRIEWIASILMQAWFFVLLVAWRRTGAHFSVRLFNR
ncbi:MAG: Frag1/DRAM/Sfk1 family protein [Gammaproteobacteria bacterium]|nr:Frag1/DRAM/Sfk1 family protein [Gammaproteobacteria bacterium]